MTIKSSGLAIIFLAACAIAVPWSAHAQSAFPALPGAEASSVYSKAADRALRKKIIRSFTKTKGLNATRITVRVKGGLVTLQGSVPEQSQIELAAQAAQSTSGVTSVTNALVVDGGLLNAR